MGSNFRQDKIGALSEAGGTISLAPSILTIGGRQFETTSSINVAVPSIASILELHFIYAVSNSGVVELRVSQNVNSVGPIGFNSWKLVGAFYTGAAPITGTLRFGSFVTIEGAPTSEMFTVGPIAITTNGGTPTKGTIETDQLSISRKGDMGSFLYQYNQTTAGSALGGGLLWLFTLPGGLTPDDTKFKPVSATGVSRTVGAGHISSATDGRDAHAIPIDVGGGKFFAMQYADGTNLNPTSPTHPFNSASWSASLEAEVPITQWDNIPLKDL